MVDDLWPEVIYERGFFKSKFLQKFLNKLAYFSYDFPQYVLPLTEEAKNHIPEVQASIVTHQRGVDETRCEEMAEKDFGVKYRARRYNIVG